jgi:hypothetical protein
MTSPFTPSTSHGAASPVTQEQVTGASTAVANGASTILTWDTKGAGDTLLDLTAPTAPTVVTAGVYSVATVFFALSELTAAGSFVAALDLDLNGEDPQVVATSPGQIAGRGGLYVALANTWYLPAAAVLQARVTNLDGVASRNFRIDAFLQRIS